MGPALHVREQSFNKPLVLHSDNGAPMKALTMKAKLEELGLQSAAREQMTTPIQRHCSGL